MAGILRVDQANVDYIYAKTAGSTVYIPGHTIQVQSASKTDVFTFSGTTWVDVTNLSVTITPKSSTSKILIIGDIKLAGTAAASTTHCRMVRNSTPIHVGDASSNRLQALAQPYWNAEGFHSPSSVGIFFDSPNTTSSTTYKFQVRMEGGYTGYVNRTQNDRDSNSDARTASSITVMEIAQ